MSESVLPMLGEKTAFWMGENNSKWNNWQTTNLKNIQATPAAQFQKNKRPSQKMGQRTKYTFSKEDIQMANKHIKRGSRSLIIREMQIKTTVRYYFMPVRMAAIQKSTSDKCWRGCGEKGTLLHCWWECKLVQPLWRTVWKFLKKRKWNCLMTQQSHCWAHTLRKPELKETHVPQCSLQHCL